MSELKAAQEEITLLQNQQGVARTDTEKQLAESRSQLSTTEAERDIARQEAQTAQSALSSQLISARNLNSSYLVEQAAHAESRRRLEALREEVSNLKQSRLLAEQAFESTEVSLKMSKDAWESQRAALQRELDDANQRLDLTQV